MTPLRAQQALFTSLIASLLASSCCEDYRLGVRDLGARISFAVDASLAIEFEWDADFEWNPSFDWGAWSQLGGSVNANVDFGGLAALAFRTDYDLDIDDDGVAETVRYLALAEEDPSNVEVIFAAWRGDRYSFDSGTCYLLWWSADKAQLLSGSCDGSDVLVRCDAQLGGEGEPECGACDANGECVDCGAQSAVSDCRENGESAFGVGGESTIPAAGGLGGESAASGAAGMAPGVSGAGGAGGNAAGADGNAAGTSESAGSSGTNNVPGSVSLDDVSVCIATVGLLVDAAKACALGQPEVAAVLCDGSAAEVSACYLAMEAASLFGDSCELLRQESSCRSVFP